MASLWKHPQSKFWTACFTDATGKKCKRSTKETDRKSALRIAVQFEDAWRRQTSAKQARRVLTDLYQNVTGEALVDVTLRHHCVAWLDSKRGEVSAATFGFYRKSVDKLQTALPEKLDKPLDRVTKADLIAWRNVALTKLSAPTVSHDLKAWRMLFQGAVDDNLIFENPVDGIKVKKKVEGDDGNEGAPKRLFTRKELKTLLEAATPEWRSMILFAAYSGLRLGDVAALSWESIDRKNGMMVVNTRKTGKKVRIPLAGPLAAHVKSLTTPKGGGAVHPQAAEIMVAKGKSSQLSNQFSELLAKVGLRPPIDKNKRGTGKGRDASRESSALSFHTLRHQVVSLLKESGASEAVVKAIVGHSNQAISDHYTHVGDGAMRDAIQNLKSIE